MNSKVLSAALVSFLALAGCDGGGTTETSHTGGSSGSGGTTGSGGGSGGNTGSGGTTGSGGSVSSGGATSSGGSGSGGTIATGGTSSTGGSGSGGTTNSGGSSGNGGSGSGGTSATGGTTAKGGSTGSGGTTSTAGITGRGGVTGTGGPGPASGGSSGVGGTTGTGGGTSVTVSPSGYPAAGASGQAKPSATGTTVTVLPWAGFKSAISFTHDDTNSSQISNYSQLAALNDKGNNARFTFYMQTGKTTELGNAVWPQAVKAGHELGNHTKSHQSAASASDIDAAESTLKSMFGVTAYSVAAPNGDASYQTVVPPMKEFLSNRTAGNSGGIAPTDAPSKQWALPCIIPATGASASAMESSITSGTSGGKWNIFLVHGFSGGSDGAYQPVSITEYTNTVKWTKDQGTYWIDTVLNVSVYWIAGYNFNKLTPTTSGTDKTWTWKTSDWNSPFPPGHYLRVKTDGGTLKQGSTTLAWDDHGYYEVSLDAGTLTLSQ